MRLLIVENNQNDLIDCFVLIDNYNENHELQLTTKIEYDYQTVLEEIDNYDFVLMDIELDNGVNGIDLACEIRKYNRDIKIILVSNFSSYLIDGYKAKADLYLLKPVSQKEFDRAINELSWDYIYHNAGIYDLRMSPNKIYFHNILYIEMNNRKLYIHFNDGEVFVCNDTLLKWEKLLEDYPFSHPHRAFLVNMEHIKTFNNKNILLNNGEILQITEVYFNSFRKNYIRYLNRRA